MNIIKNFKDFIEEGIFYGEVGPNYGPRTLPREVDNDNTTTIYYDNILYTKDNYRDLLNDFINGDKYSDYIANGGKTLNDFTEENISIIISLI